MIKQVSLATFGLVAGFALSLSASAAASKRDAALIGTSEVATATPPVPRPGTQPCVVTLLDKQLFGEKGDGARMDSTPHPVAYRPPADCAGPWAKVVMEVHFSVDAGHFTFHSPFSFMYIAEFVLWLVSILRLEHSRCIFFCRRLHSTSLSMAGVC